MTIGETKAERNLTIKRLIKLSVEAFEGSSSACQDALTGSVLARDSGQRSIIYAEVKVISDMLM